MAINQRYPYTDIHELNLDWILRKMKELKIQFDEFKVVNNITFSGTWDITKNYPAWTIVSDNNIGYVSLQPVPAGVPLTNGDYWVEVIDYTAQIAGLENRVITLEGEMIDAQNDIVDLQNANKKRYIFIGDSYNTTDTPPGGYPITPWGPVVAGFLGLSADDYYNTGVSGAGFVNGTTFLQQLQALTIDDKDSITDIVVAGGVNDENDTATLGTEITNFANYVAANFKNAIITLAMISWGKSAAGRPLLESVNYYYQTKSMLPNVRCMTDANCLYHNYSLWQTPSQGHPSLAGTNMIANGIANYLKGYDYGISNRSEDTVTISSDDIPLTGNTFKIYEQFNKSCVTTSFDNISLVLTSTNLTSGTRYKIGTYTPIYASYNEKVTVAYGLVLTNGAYKFAMFRITLDDTNVYLTPMCLENGFTSLPNTTNIAIYNPTPITTGLYEC